MTAPAPAERATLISIQRVVMPNTVRVTLELDKEVSYREERLAGPARLFFDLKNVQLTPALMDKVISYGSDVINKIRVGRHPDNTVRVVLDLEDGLEIQRLHALQPVPSRHRCRARGAGTLDIDDRFQQHRSRRQSPAPPCGAD